MKRTSLALAIGTLSLLLGSGCKVSVIGPGSDTYEACFDSSDCSNINDTCVETLGTDGSVLAACTYGCSNSDECIRGGVCVAGTSGTWCAQGCTTSSQCEVGWSCHDLTEDGVPETCQPGSPPATGINAYDECPYGTTPEQCVTGTGCWGVTVDGVMAGVCSRECTTDASCPTDARGFSGSCLAFPGQPALCFESCVDTSECQVGWACKNSANGISFPSICVPVD